MRLINALRFLFTFFVISIITFFVCLLYGTDKAIINLRKNGVILTNDENERKN